MNSKNMEDQFISASQLENMAEVFGDCATGFVFVYYPLEDVMYVSKNAMASFCFSENRFSHGKKVFLEKFAADDREILSSELDQLISGTSQNIKMEIRIINNRNIPLWVTFRCVKISSGENKHVFLTGFVDIARQTNVDLSTEIPQGIHFKKDFSCVQGSQSYVSGFIMKINIDNMRNINEKFGLAVGNYVLYLVSDCIKRAVNNGTRLYKLSGDEFVCMNLSGDTASGAQKLYTKIKQNIAEIEQKIDYEVMFTVSAGAVAFFKDKSSIDDLLKKVDFTLQSAKDCGRNSLHLFDAVSYTRHIKELDLQERLRKSIKNGFEGFELYYQPVIDAKKIYLDSENSVFNVIGAEALLRWNCPELGVVMPSQFIPILEKTGLIIPVGRWILLAGFNQCRKFNALQKNFHLNLNLSYVQVKKSDILSDVMMALEKTGVNPKNITLELTESGYMDNAQELQSLVASFQKMGINVDIDDFGTGYSNLRYLQYLNASTLKLDYSFVHKATGGDEGDRKVIKHISQMAHELGMKVCMEGVETLEDVEKLSEYGADKYQGFYFGRPCTAVDFREHYIRSDSLASVYK